MKIRMIGDVHGHYNEYFNTIKYCDASIQVGDMGYNYQPLIDNVNGRSHIFISGNHDNHDYLLQNQNKFNHCHDYFDGNNRCGFINNDIMFISGAFSIDKEIRIKRERAKIWPKTWFENEELSDEQFAEAIMLADRVKERPKRLKMIVSHEAPRSIVKYFTNPNILREFGFDPDTFKTRTSQALDMIFQIIQPEYWFFGHYHRSWGAEINGTKFRCLDELEFVDVSL